MLITNDSMSTSSNTSLNTTTETNPQQVQNYISWVNSHLKKRPGVKLVGNLVVDLSDGVLLIHLIEVLSGDVIPDANLNPKTSQEFKENIEKVLKFMQNKLIKMHQTSAKEIVDGNLRSILRLILALAAHYKPSNVQHNHLQISQRNLNNLNTNSMRHSSTRNDSITHMVQAACVSISDIRRFQTKNDAFNATYTKNSNDTMNLINQSQIKTNDTYTIDGFSNISGVLGANRTDEYLENHQEIAKEVEEIKKIMVNFQSFLLTGQETTSESGVDTTQQNQDDSLFDTNTSQEEQIVILRSKVQQLEYLCNDLKQQLSVSKNDYVQMSGTQGGLQSRLTEQDNTILQLKNEIIQLNLNNERLTKEKADMAQRFDEKTKQINDLKLELSTKSSLIDKMKLEIKSVYKEKEENKYLREQVKNFTETFQVVKKKETQLTSLIANTDRKLEVIDKMSAQTARKKMISLEEINVLKDSILKLRSSFKPNHPLQYIVNTLEQGFFTIVDRVNSNSVSSSTSSSATSSQVSSPPGSAPSSGTSTGISSNPLKTQPSSSSSSSTNSAKNDPNDHQSLPIHLSSTRKSALNLANSDQTTKVLYYTDKSVTPFMTTVFRSNDKITLADFKDALKLKSSQYRYHFKSQDPEFGIVKEEITNDGTIIPSYEGRIIAWIQEFD